MTARIATIVNSESISTPGTLVSDIGINDPISSITIRASLANSSAVPTAHPIKAIRKIEVVDGSRVLFGLTGQEALALAILLSGRNLIPLIDYMSGGVTTLIIPLMFGRALYDPLYALDPAHHSNLQLRITHNVALGGSAANAGSISATADVLTPGKTPPIGFISSLEQEDFALSAAANNYTDIPTDNALRMILLASLNDTYSPLDHFHTVKLTADNDRYVIIDSAIEDIIYRGHINNRPIIDTLLASVLTTTQIHPITSSIAQSVTALCQGQSGTVITTDTPTGASVDIRTVSTPDDVQASINGICPLGALAIPIGDIMDPTQWLQPNEAKSLKLIVKAGSSLGASPTAQVTTQHAVSY